MLSAKINVSYERNLKSTGQYRASYFIALKRGIELFYQLKSFEWKLVKENQLQLWRFVHVAQIICLKERNPLSQFQSLITMI